MQNLHVHHTGDHIYRILVIKLPSFGGVGGGHQAKVKPQCMRVSISSETKLLRSFCGKISDCFIIIFYFGS